MSDVHQIYSTIELSQRFISLVGIDRYLDYIQKQAERKQRKMMANAQGQSAAAVAPAPLPDYTAEILGFAVNAVGIYKKRLTVTVSNIGNLNIYKRKKPLYGGILDDFDNMSNPAKVDLVGEDYYMEVGGSFGGRFPKSNMVTLIFQKQGNTDQFLKEVKAIFRARQDPAAEDDDDENSDSEDSSTDPSSMETSDPDDLE